MRGNTVPASAGTMEVRKDKKMRIEITQQTVWAV
jgi:hypothetical protein